MTSQDRGMNLNRAQQWKANNVGLPICLLTALVEVPLTGVSSASAEHLDFHQKKKEAAGEGWYIGGLK